MSSLKSVDEHAPTCNIPSFCPSRNTPMKHLAFPEETQM